MIALTGLILLNFALLSSCETIESPHFLTSSRAQDPPFEGAILKCPFPYVKVGDMCLYATCDSTNPVNWQQARSYCQTMVGGGDLANLKDGCQFADAITYVRSFQSSQTCNYWVGGSDAAEEGIWKWLDGDFMKLGSPYWGQNIRGTGLAPETGTNDLDYAYLNKYDNYLIKDGISGGVIETGPLCQISPKFISYPTPPPTNYPYPYPPPPPYPGQTYPYPHYHYNKDKAWYKPPPPQQGYGYGTYNHLTNLYPNQGGSSYSQVDQFKSKPSNPEFQSDSVRQEIHSNPMKQNFNPIPQRQDFHPNPVRNEFHSNPTGGNFHPNPVGGSFHSNPVRQEFNSNPSQQDFHSNLPQQHFQAPVRQDFTNSVKQDFNSHQIRQEFNHIPPRQEVHSNPVRYEFHSNSGRPAIHDFHSRPIGAKNHPENSPVKEDTSSVEERHPDVSEAAELVPENTNLPNKFKGTDEGHHGNVGGHEKLYRKDENNEKPSTSMNTETKETEPVEQPQEQLNTEKIHQQDKKQLNTEQKHLQEHIFKKIQENTLTNTNPKVEPSNQGPEPKSNARLFRNTRLSSSSPFEPREKKISQSEREIFDSVLPKMMVELSKALHIFKNK